MIEMGRSENFPGIEFSEQGQQLSLPRNLTQQFYLQLLVEILTACVQKISLICIEPFVWAAEAFG